MSTAYSEKINGINIIRIGQITEPTKQDATRYETPEAFREAATALFGPNPIDWKFLCPNCGRIASGQEFKDAGALAERMPTDCIGRHIKGEGCDWTSLGLFDICKSYVMLKPGCWMPIFEFAGSRE